MVSAPQVIHGFYLCTITWVLLKFWNRFVRKSPLDTLSGPPSASFLLGNVSQLLAEDGWQYHRQVLDRYGRASRITGSLGERLLLTFDPKALHHILVKDQYTYEESPGFIARNEAYMGEGLLSTLGEKHRKQRKMMNPVFSINHMRDMIPLFYEVTERLRTTLKAKLEKGEQEVDILHWMTRTALELIGQSGMGYSFDTLEDGQEEHPYSHAMKRFILLIGGPFGFFTNRFVFPLTAKFNFPRAKRFIVEHIPMRRVQEIKELVDLMHNTSLEIIKANKDAMNSSDPAAAQEMLEKKDIISILMRANSQADEADRLSEEEVYGQSSADRSPISRTFVFAGMDTTSSAMSRILHLLAVHADVQKRLREEIREAQRDGQLSYDQLVALPYLDAVCRETLRLYPPINIAPIRTSRKDMMLPLSKPVVGANGKEVSEILVPSGTNIIISVLGSNTNPDLWGTDALEWKPERWLSPLPNAVAEAHTPGIYSHLMTFLGGGRACIGFKFSQLEMKVVLSVLLSNFNFKLSNIHEISWKMTNIAGPYVEDVDHTRPQLPMVMSLAD
ncbi:Cytochrome P450 3A5 [Leucoagaricus sp. SymC.cos]|nr:Cytochrome P450 3A5 [Leucoagaricus sp. SymC.cos]